MRKKKIISKKIKFTPYSIKIRNVKLKKSKRQNKFSEKVKLTQ